MDSYKLIFRRDRSNKEKIVEFLAEDASSAFAIARQEASARSAELWRNEALVCILRRTPVGTESFFVISPADQTGAK